MRSTFRPEDVELLLKDITGLVEPLPSNIRERHIQNGVHYCEMLPLEYKPSAQYMEAYTRALNQYSKKTALAIGSLAEKIVLKKGKVVTLVTLARAGTPIGILLKRYLETKYPDIKVYHYSISIIRGRGIDHNALHFILNRHNPNTIQFVDGWTGKGAIFQELYHELLNYPQLDSELAVVSDPANLTDMCGTHEDFLIPSSCLNATVTGLISRTFLRQDIIGPNDFHGAAFYPELRDDDLTDSFLDTIEREFDHTATVTAFPKGLPGINVVKQICDLYSISDINYVKPGIGETTRVLLRRVPWKIIIDPRYIDSPELDHILQLGSERGVESEISAISLGNYKVCGIIKKLSDT